jgi:outer membrane protein OmpA-like peptidoglycan-associated protein
VQRSVVSDQPAPSPSPEGETPIFGPAPQPPEPTAAPAARPCPSHGDLGQVPNDLACPTATDTRSAGTSVLFGVNSTALDPAGLATVRAVAGAWHTGGGAGVLRIDGYASVEGGQRLNWRLACARAMAVAAELEAPTDGSAGVPSANIEFFAHGETTDFSCTNLPPNRRAVITTTGGAPAPGPPCPLTISGPDEVDHYCAAYVPSDAASCGTFPAPNITLTAAGAAAGATLNWTVVAGNAAIVGAATGGSVDIQGTAASATADDVTVQVTDGSCTVAHRLTVREPSSLTSAQAPGTSGGMIQNIVTYTVQDQFGNAMGANICVDETLTLCADNSGRGLPSMGDAGTDASGQVTDTLSFFPTPANRCTLINQSITAGGCGPLLNNTITVQPAGVTLTPGASCASGDPCP